MSLDTTSIPHLLMKFVTYPRKDSIKILSYLSVSIKLSTKRLSAFNEIVLILLEVIIFVSVNEIGKFDPFSGNTD